ncbi:MAG: type IV toxin-antitoxin system AbiEi family antitoxin domain-containing protein [Holophagales bacterium]|nr:type IV toxin-antitoxin system AbiEi family antitoxin domain-containing protein [Holophagales bacterium]
MPTTSALQPRDPKGAPPARSGSAGSLVSTATAAELLGLPRGAATLTLLRLADRGWLSRVRRGLYLILPLEAGQDGGAVEDPWVLADELFGPCYVGGWTAAEHWGSPDRLFRSTFVVSWPTFARQRESFSEARFTSSAQAVSGSRACRRSGTGRNDSPSRTASARSRLSWQRQTGWEACVTSPTVSARIELRKSGIQRGWSPEWPRPVRGSVQAVGLPRRDSSAATRHSSRRPSADAPPGMCASTLPCPSADGSALDGGYG